MSKQERAVFNLLWDMTNAIEHESNHNKGSIISRYASMIDDRIQNSGYSRSVDSLKLYTIKQLEDEIESRDPMLGQSPDTSSELDSIIDKLFWSGYQTHKAALDPRNSKGLRSLEDVSKADAKAAIQAHIATVELEALKTLEAQSDCIEDQCGLDAELLRDNLLRRIRELEQLKHNNERIV